MIDFDSLADRAYKTPAEQEDKMLLWVNFFKLDEWIFVVDASKASEKPNPFTGFIDEKAWLFAFTDSQKCYEFAKKYNLLDANGKSLFISMKPESARNMLRSAEGQVEGLRINEGDHGWFSPLANVEGIHKYLTEAGRI